MFLHRIAAGLTFVAGLAFLRGAVLLESWPLLAVGLAACTAGVTWFVLVAPSDRSWPAPVPASSR